MRIWTRRANAIILRIPDLFLRNAIALLRLVPDLVVEAVNEGFVGCVSNDSTIVEDGAVAVIAVGIITPPLLGYIRLVFCRDKKNSKLENYP